MKVLLRALVGLFLLVECTFAQSIIFPGPGGGGQQSAQITRTLRFNSPAQQTLTRTFGTPTSQQVMTFSWWQHRGPNFFSAGDQYLFMTFSGASTDSNWFTNASVGVGGAAYTIGGWVNSVDIQNLFYDNTQWDHWVAAIDTNAVSPNDRVVLTRNGVLVPSTWNVPQGTNLSWGTNGQIHIIGTRGDAPTGRYWDGVVGQIYFIDGQKLAATQFGFFDGNGQWQPKTYTGTYGNNGFFLSLSNNASTTTLGADSSGNGNDWTLNNFTTADSTVDSPTIFGTDTGAGAQVRATYPVLNANDNTGMGLSNGNWRSYGNTSSSSLVRVNVPIPTSGLWYWETTITGVGGENETGIQATSDLPSARLAPSGTYRGIYAAGGTLLLTSNTGNTACCVAWSNGMVMRFAYNATTGNMWIAQGAGAWLGGGDPALGTSPTFGSIPSQLYSIFTLGRTTGGQTIWDINFGQFAYTYTAPTGFLSLNSSSLNSTTITTTGSFTGNASTNGPYVPINGVPTTMTINGNSVTFGTHAHRTANGFKVISSSGSYNTSGSNTFSITANGNSWPRARAQGD